MQLSSRLKLRAGVRLKFDRTRNANLLLLPERTVKLNHSAAAVLSCLNGTATVDDVLSLLAMRYNSQNLTKDVIAFLEEARDKGWVQAIDD
ncbi:MAG TPA: pyrroloquinoline quinone biosynthesis peptide chaperone PqqD [Candidatus Obscuribacterales bacterium]